MGSFSFYRADRTTKQANFTTDNKMRVLIPKEFVDHFGTDSFCDYYLDYGRIEVTKPNGDLIELDVYGFLAYINRDMPYNGKTVKDFYEDTDGGWADTNIQANRCIGIAIGCYPKDMVNCKYPLKLVSASYNGKYEDVKYFSCGDAAQGFHVENWGSRHWEDGTVRQYCNANCKCE